MVGTIASLSWEEVAILVSILLSVFTFIAGVRKRRKESEKDEANEPRLDMTATALAAEALAEGVQELISATNEIVPALQRRIDKLEKEKAELEAEIKVLEAKAETRSDELSILRKKLADCNIALTTELIKQ